METWAASELTGPSGGVGLPEFDENPDQAIALLLTVITNMKKGLGVRTT
jgi:hypothetical protein